MKNTPSSASAVALPRPIRTRRRGRKLAVAILAAIAIVGIYERWSRASGLAGDAIAVVYERHTLQPGKDADVAIDQLASQILSHGNIREAILSGARNERQRSEEEMADLVDRWRGLLRVDIDPGKANQPWTISIRSPLSESPADAELRVNAVAAQYCSTLHAAAVAQAENTLKQAEADSDRARNTVELASASLESKLDAMTALLATRPYESRAGAKSDQASQIRKHAESSADLTPQRQELDRELTELTARRTALLERLLPAHPDVQAIEGEIAAARAQLDKLPPDEPSPAREGPSPSDLREREADTTSPPQMANAAVNAFQEVREQQQALANACSNAQKAGLAERLAAERLARAEGEPTSRMRAAKIERQSTTLGWQPIILIAGLAAIASWTAARRQNDGSDAFQDVEEVEAALGFPVVGGLSATENRASFLRPLVADNDFHRTAG